MDDRLEKGDDIEPALLEAIKRSKIALVIFSEYYASSTWCLKELVHILGCKKNHGQIVMPIFYRIDPSHVRKQKGTYALEGLELKKRLKGSGHVVANWRAALKEAANISGFSRKTGRTEADFIEEVVQDVLTKLNMSTEPKNNTERGEGGVFEFGNKNVYKGHKKEKQVDSCSGETDTASGGENEE
ncbi:disease resistance protein RPS6-like isoform X2 [Prunus dulcis]|nr:disease resistance protein RPS6-like isoform X2 [Prunus dulcis]XP_034199016.1 disease resistance protein RPS6-like isoform X2 [Prunus dulcis]